VIGQSKVSKQDRHVADAPQVKQARDLNMLWTRLRCGHAAVGGSCACGRGHSHVRPEEFEYYVLDYLARKYRAAGQEKLVEFLGLESGTAASLQTLLDRLAQPAACRDLSSANIALLLDDLQRSLASFADAAA
jgi:hypothetical protein